MKSKPFEPGDRVRTPTGESAVVRRQFIDGSVTFRFEKGGYGEADHTTLRPLPRFAYERCGPTALLRKVQAEWAGLDVSAQQMGILREIDAALQAQEPAGAAERLQGRIGTLEAALRELCAVCNLPANNKALEAARAEVERIEQGYKARVHERDQAIASRDRFRNEIERMRPVVGAAQTWADDGEDTSFNLQRAVDAYRAEEKK